MSILKQIVLLALSLLMMKTAIAETSPELPISTGKILVVMTNHDQYPSRGDRTGLWLTELTHVYDVLTAAGYTVDFVSPQGGKVPLDQRSLGWLYRDAAAQAYLDDPAFMERLQSTRAAADIDPAAYRAIFYTGGHGTMWDFRGNKALKHIAEEIYRHGGIVSSVCHGAAGLLDLETEDGIPLIVGHRVTGFSNVEETLVGIKSQVPYLLQDELETKGARYEKSLIPFGSFVVTDGRIITGQNPGSSKEVAQALLTTLQNGKQP
ncbi:type 1 glutamine amidotransferase domain-containing protein [Aquitalea aquatica]|uniref:Type 1 glutamine amidotransferase domain-containing protein n=1 Tax=Aquitalea aquatica TaxID=3044273 RepID=A0A838Y5E1_9NEIS|nr:type 1 glutamine amidotransferase domain-containing protein [Aquitalea magnusonii]MBA4709078.1 type 1 glutamine amidotransferase domain-containing protein [Aquitalea magnusonii]